MATASSGSPASPNTTPTTITLNILSPAPEVVGGRIIFPSISLDTTVSQLKTRLRNSIAAAPPPERQRLIYRGRAVVDGTLTLKTIFQSELETNTTSSTHTLHLVLPPAPPSNAPSAVPVGVGTIPPVNQAPPAPTPVQQIHHGPHYPHQAIAQAQAAQMILQNQLNLLQQQLPIHNPTHASTEQIAQMQAQQHQRIAQQLAMIHQQQHQAHQPHHHQAPQEQRRAPSGMQDTRNPDHAAQWNPHQSGPAGQGLSSGAPLPMGPTTTTVHEGIGPNGSRMRVVVNETINYHVSRQGTPVAPWTGTGQPPSANAAFHPPPNVVPTFHSHGLPGRPSPPPGLPLPYQSSPMAPGRQPSASAHGQQNSSLISQADSAATTTAWLLSTPSGPQALLFAPGHGYFSSAATPTTAQLTNSNRPASLHSTRHHEQPSNDHIGHAPALPDNPPLLPAGNGANDPPAQAVARPGEQQEQQQQQQHQRQANNNENDVLQFIFQRGWLFLRLYIFMFVLSEPGTWRRWFLLAVAVIVCLLPQENPLHNLMNRIRAHIEGLVPIAAVPQQQRQDQAAQDRGEGAGNGGQARAAAGPAAAGPAAQQPSPEQAAARIIRQNQVRQNHGIVRDTIFRVERALALFLASLVPGVGERHVRAREEARREAERIENERLAVENVRAAEEIAKNESKATSDETTQAHETGAEPSPSTSGERTTTAT